MNLLSPFFLVGLAMIAGPIIAHLIRRATKDRLEFSAIRFLKPSTPRLDRREDLFKMTSHVLNATSRSIDPVGPLGTQRDWSVEVNPQGG